MPNEDGNLIDVTVVDGTGTGIDKLLPWLGLALEGVTSREAWDPQNKFGLALDNAPTTDDPDNSAFIKGCLKATCATFLIQDKHHRAGRDYGMRGTPRNQDSRPGAALCAAK